MTNDILFKKYYLENQTVIIPDKSNYIFLLEEVQFYYKLFNPVVHL